jgi:hypothetical protein
MVPVFVLWRATTLHSCSVLVASKDASAPSACSQIAMALLSNGSAWALGRHGVLECVKGSFGYRLWYRAGCPGGQVSGVVRRR